MSHADALTPFLLGRLPGVAAPAWPAAAARPHRVPAEGGARVRGGQTAEAQERARAEALVDGALVRAVRGGDAEAYGELVRRHLEAVHSAALSVLADATDAEDVCQDAFAIALERLEQCRPAEKFRPWLLVITRNRALDLRRRQRVRSAEPLDTPGAEREASAAVQPTRDPGPLAAAERADARKHLLAALATLTDVRREVVLLHDLEDWSHREIAQHLGLAEGTVRAHLFWARRALRKALSPEFARDPRP